MLRVLLLLAGLALVPLALLLLALAALQSEAVRTAAVDAVNRWVPGVTVEGLDAGLPTRLDIARIALGDDAGVWLELEDLSLAWRPTALFDGRLQVDHVTAARLHLRRTPAAAPGPAEPPAPGEPAPLTLPARIFPVVVERLAIEEIRLDAPVVGAALTLGLDGRLDAASGTTVAAALDLRRLDAAGLEADLDATVDLAAGTLDLDLTARERSGFVAALTGEPRLEPLTLSLRGAGPLDAWPGRLEAEIGRLATLAVDLDLRAPDPLGLALDGRIEPGPALAETAYAPLLEGGIAIALEATQAPAATTLDALRITADWLEVEGSARLEGERVQATLDAAVPDLGALSAIAGQPLAGGLRLEADLDGALPLPAGELRLTGSNLEAAGIALAALEQRVELAPRDDGGIALDATGRLRELVVGAGDARLEETFAIDAAAQIVPGGPFALERLRVDGRTLALAARADGDLGAGTAQATATVDIPDLAAWRALSPAVPAGALTVEARADLGDGFHPGTLRLEGAGDGLDGLPAPAGALLGSAPTFTLDARLAPLPTIAIETVALRGSNLTVDGAGEVDTAALGGRLAVAAEVPSLAPVGAALGQDLAGRAKLDLTGEGDLDAFTADARLDVPGFGAAGQSFDAVGLTLTAAGSAAAVDGRLEARASKADGALTLASAYTVEPSAVRLRDLALDAPGLGLAGGLDVALDPLGLDGGLAGGSSSLAPLGSWLGLPLAGALDLDIGLDPAAQQTATVQASARDLDLAGLALGGLDVDARATRLFATPTLDAEATVTGFVQGATTVETARLDVGGDLERLDVDLEAAGGLPDPFTVSGGAVVRREGTATTATLERLTGEVGEVPVRLTAPASVRLDGGVIELDGLELEVAGGRIEAQARLGTRDVAGRVGLAEFELSTLSAFGAPPLDGMLDAEATLAGTRAAPVLAATAELTGLRQAASDGEPIALEADVDLEGGGLEAALTADGLGSPPLVVTARLPVRFALEPFTFAVPEPLPLDANIAGAVDLARSTRWYGLDGQEVTGTLRTDLAVGGSLDRPDLVGDVRLADGRVVDVNAGILLDAITLVVEAEGQRLVLRELTATDGGTGRLSGEGGVTLGGASLAAFDLDATLERFAAVQSEDIFVETSGEARVTGEGADLDVFGRFTVNRGEITIPEGGGARDFATLDVVRRDEAEAEAEADAPAPPGEVALDVVVTIPGQFFVRGRGLVSEWEGRVEVAGTAARPRIGGLIEYRRGHIDVLNSRFQFREGTIRLTGTYPPEPFLDIEATVETQETTAVLSVSGPAFDPDIGLSSEPELPEDEIVSRLLFDRSRERINSVQALRLAAAVNELRGGGAGFGVLETLRTGLGVDTLDIEGDTEENARLRAGTYVTEDVFVEFGQGLKAGSASARVEVELTPRIRAETRVNEDQTGSVGLRWRYDY